MDHLVTTTPWLWSILRLTTCTLWPTQTIHSHVNLVGKVQCQSDWSISIVIGRLSSVVIYDTKLRDIGIDKLWIVSIGSFKPNVYGDSFEPVVYGSMCTATRSSPDGPVKVKCKATNDSSKAFKAGTVLSMIPGASRYVTWLIYFSPRLHCSHSSKCSPRSQFS